MANKDDESKDARGKGNVKVEKLDRPSEEVNAEQAKQVKGGAKTGGETDLGLIGGGAQGGAVRDGGTRDARDQGGFIRANPNKRA